MLLYWASLFAIINGWWGEGLGLQYLFLSPEYLDESSPIAFLLLGAGVGGFIMAYHIYSYVQLGPSFPFIATLYRPFYKFSHNNSLIPVLFMINLSINVFHFQRANEYVEPLEIFFQIFALNGGAVIFIMISLLYFLPTNKDLYKITGKNKEDFHHESSNIHTVLHRHQTWFRPFLYHRDETYYYLNGIRINKSRSSSHYDINTLHQVFSQNHINASVFEILLLVSFVLLGLFRDYELFQVPASVSIMMLLTVIVMFVSALFSWFKSWTIPFIILIFVLANYINQNTNFLQFKSYAYGLSYEQDKRIDYDKNTISELILTDEIIEEDYRNYLNTLENWKEQTGESKPKLVILNSSGGGLRSAMWTFNVLQILDSITQKDFTNHVQLMTGASGGMVGAAYYRELIAWEKDSLIKTRLGKQYLENISKDLLNRLSFSIPTNDLFFRFKKEEINGHKYVIDRGYEFEQEMIKNLDGAFDKTLGEYEEAERSGKIPTLILTPSIVNDGRRLIISPQHHGYLQSIYHLDEQVGLSSQSENIEYLKFFENNTPKDLLFSSALRMSATFPYIMPMITMPTTPDMFIMDAGIRDNYGYKFTIQYLLALEDWIKENTSGVIVLRVRDNKKDLFDNQSKNVNLFGRLFLPFGNMYGNFLKMQDFNQDELFSAAVRNLDYPIDVVTFNLREEFENRISLSWHLTEKEKAKIKDAIHTLENQKALERLLKSLHFLPEN